MARSTLSCSCPHCHHHCNRHHCGHHSHNVNAHAHGHKRIHNHNHHRHSIHGCQESHEPSFSHSPPETALTEYDLTETTTQKTCLTEQTQCTYPTTTTTGYSKSNSFGLRHHEVLSLHVSVNLRLAGTNTVLLAEDVFVPIAGSESLKGIFEAALIRYPHLVGRYILRREKDVVVLCHDEEKNTYATTTIIFAALSKLRPIRLIFCVLPNVEVIRELDSQKNYTLKVNARSESDRECILEKDAIAEARGNVSAQQLWTNLIERVPQIRDLAATGVLTRRPDDNVVVRFGMHDFVADLVKSGGRRFVFIIGDHHMHEHHEHGDDEYGKHRQQRHSNSDDRMRFKFWFRLRRDPHKLGWRRFQWGLIEKK